MQETKRIPVFILEDNELTKVAIRSVLEKVAQFQVAGEAADGESAVAEVGKLQPQVVLADIGLPGGMNGIEATKQIKKNWPNIKVVMLTSHDSDRDIFNSFDAGADGYVIKELFGNKLELAIDSVCAGSTWLDPRIAQRVLKAASTNFHSQEPELRLEADAPEPLSEAEMTALTEVAEADQPTCKDGVCSIDPDFLRKLHRFARSPKLET